MEKVEKVTFSIVVNLYGGMPPPPPSHQGGGVVNSTTPAMDQAETTATATGTAAAPTTPLITAATPTPPIEAPTTQQIAPTTQKEGSTQQEGGVNVDRSCHSPIIVNVFCCKQMGKFPTDQKDTKGKDDSHSSGSGGSFMDASPPIKKDKDKKGEKLSKVEDGDNQDKEQHDGYQDKCGSQKTKEDPSDNNNASRMGKREQIEESGQVEEESCTPLPKKTLDTSPMDISPTTIETSDLEKESKGKRKAASSDDDMPPEKKTKGGLAINN